MNKESKLLAEAYEKVLEEKKKKKRAKKKRSSKYYGWGWIGYGPGVYGDSGSSGGDGGGGE